MSNIATYRLKDIPLVLVTNYLAGTNTFLSGKPAMGKTETIKAYAEEMQRRDPNFKLWLFYAPTMSPMDIIASAPDYDRGTLRLYCNDALPNAYVNPDVKGCVFFGELPNTDPATLKLLQKYINGEDMSGVMRKPDGVVVVADGNRLEDKSGVLQHGRAFLSRFEQLEVYSPADDNIAFAAKHAWHPHVQTFFHDNPALIDNYDEVFETSDAALQRSDKAKQNNGSNHAAEEGRRGIWANMRAWERISKKEYVADAMKREISQNEIAGNVGSAVAAQYQAHRHILSKLVAFDQIMVDPTGVPVPEKMDQQYMLTMIVSLRCTPEQLPMVRRFAERLPLEMQALLLRQLTMRKGFNLAATPDYQQWIKSDALKTLLNGR